MSQQRRERQKEKSGDEGPDRKWRRIATRVRFQVLITAAALVFLAAAYRLADYLDKRIRHKHDAFARCLGDRGLRMYGAFWCPHCQEQKEKFSASFEYAPYVECGVKGDTRAVAQVCKDAGIKHFPTWQFPPTGERVERVFTLEELSERSGCSLP